MRILAAICLLALGVNAQVGPSGIVGPDGHQIQFSHDLANDILLRGPSGIVTKSGKNIQLTSDLHFATPRAKRSPSLPIIGDSGIITPSGELIQLPHGTTGKPHIILEGPSGYILSNGVLLQKRAKRDLQIGDSGLIGPLGQLIQFRHGTQERPYVILEGPSGYILSNGVVVQKRAKRDITGGHVVGHSGIITRDGQLIQFAPGVSVVHAGPSGVVLSNGENIQLP